MTEISDLITLREAGKQLGNVPRETVRRWIVDGVNSGGKVHKLHAFRVGGRWMTTKADIDNFLLHCRIGLNADEYKSYTAEQSRAAARLKGSK